MFSPSFRTFICFLAATAFGTAAPIPILPKGLQGASQPQLSVGRNGSIHLVFGKGTSVFYAGSSDGLNFSGPVKVADLPQLALGRRTGPRVATVGATVLVTATSYQDGLIQCWRSTDKQRSWQALAPINTVRGSGAEGFQEVASDGAGLVAVAWVDLRNKAAEVWCRVSRDGASTWGPETRVYASTSGSICACCHANIALGPNHEIGVMWRNALDGARDLWMASSSDAGKTFSAARKLGSGTWLLDKCPMDGGDLAFDEKGAPISVWRRESSIYSSGSSEAEVLLSKSGAQPVVQTSASGTVYVWEENGGISIKAGASEVRQLSSNGRAPALAKLPNGKVIAAWETAEGQIMAEILK